MGRASTGRARSGYRAVSALLVCALAAPTFAFGQTPAPAAPAAKGAKPAAPASASAKGPAPAASGSAAAAASAAVSPPPAPAAPDMLVGDAKKDYDAGKLLFGDGDFAGARLKFKSAYEATKDPRPLWNWAACEKNLRHYAKALTLIDSYLKDDRISADERSDAGRLRDTLTQFTAPVSITVSEAGADIAVDGESAGQSPLAGPLTLDMGPRKIDVTKAGFKAFTSSIVVSPGSNTPVNVKLDLDVHQGHLVVKAPAGAAITIDGAAVAVGSWQGTLSSGGHTLQVSAPGMRIYHDEVTLMDDQTRTLDISLESESSGVPKWVWVAGGVLVAGGLGVGGYFLFKKPETTTEPPTGATLGVVPLQ